jgi:hypothetical protein
MLRFVVRYFRWLARIPLAPQFFDALLLIGTAVFHRETLRAIEALEAGALGLPGVSPAPHRFGGIGFRRDGREFAHVHGNGLLDVKMTRELAAEIVAAGRARPHHAFGPSAWISFQLRTPEDCEPALALLRMADDRNAYPEKGNRGPTKSTKPNERKRLRTESAESGR